MYSTHTDESYEPTDGTSSKAKGGGILDVGNALKKNLEGLGIQVLYDETNHMPHDAGAYRRSRQTARNC
jgi:stage II sporulation protein P